MKPILISLALLLALCSCSSTKRGQKAPAATSPVSTSSGNAFPQTVARSPAQPAPAVVVSSVQAAPPASNAGASPAPLVATPRPALLSAAEVQQIPFQVSISSVTVEKLAAQQGCIGGKGASLATEKGPVEVYKMQCDNGKVFLAKCELRQCKAFSWQ